MPSDVDRLIRELESGPPQPAYLVHGELVLAEPAARRLAEAVAEALGTAVDERRRPARLAPILENLRTYSLFASAKVMLVVDSAALADRSAAAQLIDEVAEVLPVAAEGELSGRERQAASRLLQALRLFELSAEAGSPEAVIGQLPDWAVQGARGRGGRKRVRGKRQVADLREGLTGLLAAARSQDLSGFAEGELAQLGELLRGELPPKHCLILAERTVAPGHPLIEGLSARKAVVAVGQVQSGRGGSWEGLEPLARELAQETGVEIARDALTELARRTLRQEGQRGSSAVDAESTARLAGEYRKLATMAQGRIDRRLVAEVVLDRGQEDVFQILDAVGAGRTEEALGRLRRYLGAAADPIAARLSFFALLAGFCRHLMAVRGMMKAARVAPGETNFSRFKSRSAPALQAEPPGGGKNPLAGLHPFRLHKAYLAASRLPESRLNRLPWRVLQTELLLKGESTEPDAALSALLVELTAA